MTDFKFSRWHGEKEKNLNQMIFNGMNELYFKKTMESHLNYELLLEDKHLLAKENG